MTGIYRSNPAILNEARNYINGLMLSDGTIHCKNEFTGRYIQGCKYKNWLDIINEDLYEYNIKSNVDDGRIRKYSFCSKNGSILYMLQSIAYIEFRELRDYWYKRWYDISNYNEKLWHKDESGEYYIFKKIVPRDIKLTPECVANLYIGDGCLHKDKRSKHNSSYTLTISVMGFDRSDILFLSDLLSEVIDIKCSVSKRGDIFICKRSDVSGFINYIKDYKVDCYDYKFLDVMR